MATSPTTATKASLGEKTATTGDTAIATTAHHRSRITRTLALVTIAALAVTAPHRLSPQRPPPPPMLMAARNRRLITPTAVEATVGGGTQDRGRGHAPDRPRGRGHARARALTVSAPGHPRPPSTSSLRQTLAGVRRAGRTLSFCRRTCPGQEARVMAAAGLPLREVRAVLIQDTVTLLFFGLAGAVKVARALP